MLKQSITKLTKLSLHKAITNILQVEIPEQIIKIDNVTSSKDVDYKSACLKILFNKYKNKETKKCFGLDSEAQIGEKLVQNFTKDEVIEEIMLGQGNFINIKLNALVLESYVNEILQNGVQFNNPKEKELTVAVDFSSPNISKVMHIAHLRSTILGDSLSRIFEYMGHKVYRINHVGDWGTQFGMIIRYIELLDQRDPALIEEINKIAQEKVDVVENKKVVGQREKLDKEKIIHLFLQRIGDKSVMDNLTLTELHQIYKDSYVKFKAQPQFNDEAHKKVVELQSGEESCHKKWLRIFEISFEAYNKIYDRLDIKLETMGESFYKDKIPETLQELKEKQLVKEDQGAQCIFLEKMNPLIVVKKDGGFNYDTTDIACIKYRIQTLNANKIIYITDIGQENHFFQVFAATKKAGWQGDNVKLHHCSFGIIQDKDGKRLKSRSGESLKLEEFLDEAKRISFEQLKARSEEQKTEFTEAEALEIADKLSIASIKYFDLKQNGNYKFEYEKVLSTKGNTGVYLLYSYVRLCSIIRKSGFSEQELEQLYQQNQFKMTHQQERNVMVQMIKFNDMLDQSINELKIGHLTDYVYDLSTKISEGMKVKDYKIIDPEFVKQRVILIEAARRIFKKTLDLLGIETLEKL